jgi:hypothetical protein
MVPTRKQEAWDNHKLDLLRDQYRRRMFMMAQLFKLVCRHLYDVSGQARVNSHNEKAHNPLQALSHSNSGSLHKAAISASFV